ncbi:hypothetical protein L6164_019504 [Bauhinia variegata]|uniref:Uncharacterized protein n=1 Tax=Bauhinia variegata TaxID=167791 RepID=A0ACB9MS05_BAUVA|nr:hypothetical protein L6164_019504 [Bauhinia variegata]
MVSPSQAQAQAQQSSCSSVLEITLLSADGIHHKSSSSSSTLFSLYSRRIRPFVTLTKLPATPTHCDRASHVYSSEGGFNPSWDQKFRVPVDSAFFSDQYSFIHLQLYNKRPIVGQAKLGSCLIPATDIGFLPPGSVRYLSYRLRSRDGSRGNGIINLSVKWDRFLPWMSPALGTCQTVIGIPVTNIQGTSDCSTNPELETGEIKFS